MLEFVQTFVCFEVSPFTMVGYVREMTSKKFCKYGENGSFDHLLFLLHDRKLKELKAVPTQAGPVTGNDLLNVSSPF